VPNATCRYKPPCFLKNGHVQTIYPVWFRTAPAVAYQRERINTPDNDFLDLDWSVHQNNRLVIISHGLEGNSHRAYVKGMVNAATRNGWDALAWNYRSCSGEPNKKLRSYHNGVVDDLTCVIHHAKTRYAYRQIALVGFSLGGNLNLLYLGSCRPDPIVKKAVVFSVPCDLKGSSEELKKPFNKIYMKRFLHLLHQKIKAKAALFPDQINDKGYKTIKDFKGFDDRYTAPIHGFKDAHDYWAKCSSKPHISKIRIPTLIVNAVNDPFLSDSCYPVSEADANPNVRLCMPDSGGHVGFIAFNSNNLYWSEKTAVSFLNQN
jgi:predicted alpha/beta-fold hydrolase